MESFIDLDDEIPMFNKLKWLLPYLILFVGLASTALVGEGKSEQGLSASNVDKVISSFAFPF